MTPRLIEIPLSHYCEKARWALDHHRIPYIRESHVPFVSRAAGAVRGVWTSVPVLLTEAEPVRESAAIVRWADGRGAGAPLWPEDPVLRGQVDVWVELFDGRLGPAARRIAYSHVLSHRDLATRLLLDRIGAVERTLVRPLLPFVCGAIQRGLRVTPEGVASSQRRLAEVWARVDAALGSQGEYLAGDRFTAADLTWAALAGPLILPPGLGPVDASDADLPAEFRILIEQLRHTPAGRHVLRTYARHRSGPQ